MTATLDDVVLELQTLNTLLRRVVVLNKTAKVTPTNSVDLPGGPCKGLILSAAGLVTYMTANENGSRGVFRNAVALQQGYNPLPVIQVWSTGTDVGITIEAVY